MYSDAKRTLGLIRGCWKTLFLFEILFRLFSTYVVFALCKLLFNGCLRLTRLYYLTAENLVRFVTNPVMILCCIVILLLFALTSMLEISCLITCLHTSQTQDTLGIFQLIYEGIKDSLRLLQPQNLPLLLVTAVLIPVTQLPTSTSPLRLINLPWKSLAEYAFKFPYILAVIAYLIGTVLYFGLAMCVYHRFVLEDSSAKQAFQGALHMNRGVRLYRLVELGLFVAAACGIAFGGAAVISFGLNRIIPLFTDNLNAQYRIRLPFDVILNFFKSSSPITICFGCIGAFYYTAKRALGEPIPGQALSIRKNAQRFNAIVFYIVIAATITCVILYDTVVRPTLARYDALEYVSAGNSTLIIAHRGYSRDSDENTLSAFQAASELGVDYIELDVQQTADGVVIVHHDNSFLRVFGDRRKVWEITYDEVRGLSSLHSGECPPTLYEVLTLCDPQANLLIELKNNGHNPGLPQAVYAILEEYQCLDRCVIQSSSYRMLREFKELAPNVRCGYILSFALGEYASLRAADFFSIDSNFVSASVLSTVHRSGKDLYAWTINDDRHMREMLDLGVDGIITDDVPLAKTTLLSIGSSPLEELIADPLEEALTAQTEPLE